MRTTAAHRQAHLCPSGRTPPSEHFPDHHACHNLQARVDDFEAYTRQTGAPAPCPSGALPGVCIFPPVSVKPPGALPPAATTEKVVLGPQGCVGSAQLLKRLRLRTSSAFPHGVAQVRHSVFTGRSKWKEERRGGLAYAFLACCLMLPSSLHSLNTPNRFSGNNLASTVMRTPCRYTRRPHTAFSRQLCSVPNTGPQHGARNHASNTAGAVNAACPKAVKGLGHEHFCTGHGGYCMASDLWQLMRGGWMAPSACVAGP